MKQETLYITQGSTYLKDMIVYNSQGNRYNLSNNTTTIGANGGSGIVILRYPGSQKGSGGTVTSSGGYTYHTFTGSGTFTA